MQLIQKADDGYQLSAGLGLSDFFLLLPGLISQSTAIHGIPAWRAACLPLAYWYVTDHVAAVAVCRAALPQSG